MSLLSHWSGSLPPTDGRIVEAQFRWQREGPATDYDRACDVKSPAAIISVGSGHAIALYEEGAMPVAALPTEQGGLLVAQLYTVEEPGLPEQLPGVPRNLPWIVVGEFMMDDVTLRLMHATEPGGREPTFGVMDVPLAAGRYRVEGATLRDPEMEVWFVRLEPV